LRPNLFCKRPNFYNSAAKRPCTQACFQLFDTFKDNSTIFFFMWNVDAFVKPDLYHNSWTSHTNEACLTTIESYLSLKLHIENFFEKCGGTLKLILGLCAIHRYAQSSASCLTDLPMYVSTGFRRSHCALVSEVKPWGLNWTRETCFDTTKIHAWSLKQQLFYTMRHFPNHPLWSVTINFSAFQVSFILCFFV